MGVKKEDLVRWIGGLETLKDDVPEIMSQIAVGEGQYAVRQARLICKNDSPDIVNTGDYRRNWKSDKTARRNAISSDFTIRLTMRVTLNTASEVTSSLVTGKGTPSSITGTIRKVECSSARRAVTSGDTSP